MTPDLADLWARTNPWHLEPGRLPRLARRFLPAKWVPRTATARLHSRLGDPHSAHLVVGPRQAGKRALVWALLADLKRPVLALDGDDLLVQAWSTEPQQAAQDIESWLPQDGIVFLENAHALREPGRLLQGLVESRLSQPIVATGCASAASLSGGGAHRITSMTLGPLRLDEVARPIEQEPPAVRRQRLRRAVEGMLLFGGYPPAWTSPDPRDFLLETLETSVLREASLRFRIDKPMVFRRLLRLAASRVGKFVNHSEWARILDIASTTVADYLEILVESHVLRLVRPFSGGGRSELTRAPKLYFVDNGLRNALVGGFDPLERRVDLQALVENLVFTELSSRLDRLGDIRCWRTRNGAEIDFVLEPEPGRLVAIAVKATPESRPRLPRAGRSFIQAYSPTTFWMVTRGEPFEDRLANTLIRGIPLELLSQALEDL